MRASMQSVRMRIIYCTAIGKPRAKICVSFTQNLRQANRQVLSRGQVSATTNVSMFTTDLQLEERRCKSTLATLAICLQVATGAW